MSELERIREIIEKLGLNTKIENDEIVAVSSQGKEIIIKIGSRKPRRIPENKKIIIISPYIVKKIESTILEKILNSEKTLLFINKNTLEKIFPITFLKIANYLRENPNSHINKIAKDLNLHPEKVRRVLISMRDYIEIKSFENKYLPKLPRLISLRKNLTEEELKRIASEKIRIIPSQKKKRKTNYRKIKKDDALPLILKFIEENPGTHLREISRKLKINPAIVHYCLKEVSEFIDVITPSNGFSIDLPNLPVQIKIKEGYTADGILKVIKVKKLLNEKSI